MLDKYFFLEKMEQSSEQRLWTVEIPESALILTTFHSFASCWYREIKNLINLTDEIPTKMFHENNVY